MNNKKRSHPQRAVRTTRRSAGLRGSLEAKLLKFCADIGWICGWREVRMEPVPSARRSSRKRVMLGRVLAADAEEAEAFRPFEVAFVSSGRTAYTQSETAAEANGLADLALDAQERLARLGRTFATCSFNEAASRYAEHFPRTASRRLVGLRTS